MRKILLIDDSLTVLKALKDEISTLMDDVIILAATTYRDASDIIRHNNDISVAVVDINLPDCSAGKAALLTSSHSIPSIVLTSTENDNLKEILLKKNILDYVKKDSFNSIGYTAMFVNKIIRNFNITALVVDDSSLFRKKYEDDLKKLQINVLEAKDGQEALEIIESSDTKVSLVLTDYNMPKMDGIELTIQLRQKYKKDTLAIIALSASEDSHVLADFIKAGANDFLTKPHKFEELNVRVQSNLDILELFQKTKDLANKDFLTGAYNRRYFFEASSSIIAKNVRKDKKIVVATIDIDKFKNVNDTYGHDVGDIAIKEIIKVLDKSLRKSDLVARFGGEEFCILLEDISIDDMKALFDNIRNNFEINEIIIKDIVLKYTVSIGVAYGKSDDINKLLKISDEALYEAKETGRNKVVVYKTKS